MYRLFAGFPSSRIIKNTINGDEYLALTRIMASGRIDLSPLPFFDLNFDPSSLGPHWKSSKRRFKAHLAALGIADRVQKRAFLLYQSGSAPQDIFYTMTDTGDGDDSYFTPRKNINSEVFTFRKELQRPDETVDQYITRLPKLASTCNFTNANKEIKSVLIQNCSTKLLQRYAFVETDVTLSQLLTKARAFQSSEIQAAGIETSLKSLQLTNDKAHTISTQFHSMPSRKKFSRQRQGTTKLISIPCSHCGGSWPHLNRPYPAKGKTCNTCGKNNHFASVCAVKSIL